MVAKKPRDWSFVGTLIDTRQGQLDLGREESSKTNGSWVDLKRRGRVRDLVQGGGREGREVRYRQVGWIADQVWHARDVERPSADCRSRILLLTHKNKVKKE